jgi:hypothetical protein
MRMQEFERTTHGLLFHLFPVFRMTLASLKKLYKRVGTFGEVVAHLNLQLVCQTGETVSSKNMEKVLSKYYHNRLSGPMNDAIDDALRVSNERECAASDDEGESRDLVEGKKKKKKKTRKKKIRKKKRKRAQSVEQHKPKKMATIKKKTDLQIVKADNDDEGSNENDEHLYLALRGIRKDELNRTVAILVDWGESLSWQPSDNFQNSEDLDAFELRVHELDDGLRVWQLETLEPRFGYMNALPIGEEVQRKPEKLSGPNEKPTFVCHQCPASYTTLRSLRRHYQKHGRPLIGIDTTSHSSPHAGVRLRCVQVCIVCLCFERDTAGCLCYVCLPHRTKAL